MKIQTIQLLTFFCWLVSSVEASPTTLQENVRSTHLFNLGQVLFRLLFYFRQQMRQILIVVCGQRKWNIKSTHVAFGWKDYCSPEQVCKRIFPDTTCVQPAVYTRPLKPWDIIHEKWLRLMTKANIFLPLLLSTQSDNFLLGTVGLIGNFLSIVILSKPDMYNSFNQLLIALSTMDSIFIILAIIDYSFSRYVVHLPT